jgi:hypothetical protein
MVVAQHIHSIVRQFRVAIGRVVVAAEHTHHAAVGAGKQDSSSRPNALPIVVVCKTNRHAVPLFRNC